MCFSWLGQSQWCLSIAVVPCGAVHELCESGPGMTGRCGDGQVCNALCDDIESVPYHRVIAWGGKRSAQDFRTRVEVFDCGSLVWHQPEALGTPPSPRYTAHPKSRW